MERGMDTVAIVVVAYNRPDSLSRLLMSLAAADYPEDKEIPLIISIDKGNNAEVIRAADNFAWIHGEKSVVCRDTNLGLKQHVLLCGDYTKIYGNIIMLEDDLYVSPAFYYYAQAALAFSDTQEDIGGISLYNHQLNVHVREPFAAIHDGYDNWYFQFASSWGQAFGSRQWSAFLEWFQENGKKPLASANIPENVSSWSDRSWLKYYIKYLVESGKYFLYPQVSLTTNFSEEGVHAAKTVTDLQVPLAGRIIQNPSYRFSSLQESGAVYDAFFENICLKKQAAAQLAEMPEEYCKEEKIEIDLYGYKPIGSKVRY
ncbi:MAG TPA: hypothetical protein PLU43_07995, partial [Lachnospiraceae bacterium]|nr:hypothetical protein [Lachnospiraceae bacterium]